MASDTISEKVFLVFSLLFLAAEINAQTTPDDNAPPHRFRSCRASSYCIPIRMCSSLRDGWNRSGVGVTCGQGSGPYRLVCCPRVHGEELPVLRKSTPTSTTATTTTVLPPKTEGCGQLSHEIDWSEEPAMEDSAASEATWPWMVAITLRNNKSRVSAYCTGFLIDRRHVLSTAACYVEPVRRKERYGARIGSDDVDAAEEYPIIEIKLHEGYRRGRFYDNIAILTLGREVNTPHFAPICLPGGRLATMDLTGWGTTVLGWGSERLGDPTGNTLKQLDNVPVLTNNECNQIFMELLSSFERHLKFPRGISDDMMCLGQTEGARDACGSDYGGPAMILYKKRWYAVGMISFGYLCNSPGVPGGYTRISSYVDWIKQNAQNGPIQNTTTAL